MAHTSKHTQVDILHLPDGSDKWEVITRLPLLDETEFQFDCMDFSPICALWEKIVGPQNFLIKGYLHSCPKKDFTLAFLLQNDLLVHQHLEKMKDKEAKVILEFDLIVAKENDVIEAEIWGEEADEVSFKPNGKFSFKVQECYKLKKKTTFDFSLVHNTNTPEEIILTCNVKKSGLVVDGDRCFHFSVEEKKQDSPGTSTTVINNSAVSIVEGAKNTRSPPPSTSSESTSSFVHKPDNRVNVDVNRSSISIGNNSSAKLYIVGTGKKGDGQQIAKGDEEG